MQYNDWTDVNKEMKARYLTSVVHEPAFLVAHGVFLHNDAHDIAPTHADIHAVHGDVGLAHPEQLPRRILLRHVHSLAVHLRHCLTLKQNKKYTVKSPYKEPAYKELLVIRNRFPFPNLYQGTSLLYAYKKCWL